MAHDPWVREVSGWIYEWSDLDAVLAARFETLLDLH